METKVSYTIVGLFVIILTIVFIIGVIWLSVGISTTSYETYLVYMHESVSGLSNKSPVKYNGVEVGHVSAINLVEGKPNIVRLTLEIDEETPVTVDTRAQLDTQGLTGIAYVELKGGRPGSPPLKAEGDQKYPVIRSIPSFLFRLDSALTQLSTNLESISKGLSALVSKKNTTLLTNILQNIEEITDKITENSEKLEDIIDDAQITLQNTAVASEQLPEVLDNINIATQDFDEMTQNFMQASEEAKSMFGTTQSAVQTINNQVIPDAVQSFQELKNILNSLKGTSQQIEQNPSVLIRGRAPLPPGPGE